MEFFQATGTYLLYRPTESTAGIQFEWWYTKSQQLSCWFDPAQQQQKNTFQVFLIVQIQAKLHPSS